MRSVLLLGIALLGGCCFAPTSGAGLGTSSSIAAGGCLGHWQGTGVQPGYPPWPIDLVVTESAANACGTIEYPSLGCGGTLTSCNLVNGATTVSEIYTHTTGNCSPPGTITATCSGATMTWTWTGVGGPVTTTLTRVP
ncbi:MAG: hypothetical protein U0234_33365 [Sandaracinus sp.]